MEAIRKKQKVELGSPLGSLTRSAAGPGIEKLAQRHTLITTIVFDLSEVLLTGMKGVEYTLEPVLKVHAEQIRGMMLGKDLALFFNGRISEDEYLSRLIKKNRLNADPDTLKTVIRENFREINGTRPIIERLKERGFKLGLLSVHGREWVDYASKKFNYHRLFHSVLYSFEVSASKPDKKAYKLMLERLGSKPEECLFIDDTPANISSASELGMQTILFKSADQLDDDLRSLGVMT